MATFKTEGIIIARRNFEESGRLLTVLTRDHGKIIVIAKGARKLTSRKVSSVELFNHCKFVIANGKNLGIITEVEVLRNYSNLKTKLSKIGQGYLVLELVDRFCVHGAELTQVFDLTREVLGILEKPITYPQRKIVILAFKYQLLLTLGFLHPTIFGLRDFPGYFGQIALEKVAGIRPALREFKIFEQKVDNLIEKTLERRVVGNTFVGQIEALATVST